MSGRIPLVQVDAALRNIDEMSVKELRNRFARILMSMRGEIRASVGDERKQRVLLFKELKRLSGDELKMRQGMKQLILGMMLNIKLGFRGEEPDYIAPVDQRRGEVSA